MSTPRTLRAFGFGIAVTLLVCRDAAATPPPTLQLRILSPRASWATGPELLPSDLFVAHNFVLRSSREANWWLWQQVPGGHATQLRLRDESVRDAPDSPSRAGMGAGVRALKVPNERWTSLSVRRAFDQASVEAGLEGLTSEPLPAIDRRGKYRTPLRRAGAVLGVRFGRPTRIPSVFDVGAAPHGRATGNVMPAMVVRAHARRWLGHGQRPVMDVRWRAEAAITGVHHNSGLVAQLHGHVTWRQVAGARGQVLQVGSFPVAGETLGPLPHILYEPIIGHEDLARYTAHLFSAVAKAELRLRTVALGAFVNATQIDHPRRVDRDAWLLATGPSVAARLSVGHGKRLFVRAQSARRVGAEGSRWLHLVTLGV